MRKHIKLFIAFITFFSLSIVTLLVVSPLSYAQSGKNVVAVTQYKPGEMLDFFFLNSVQALTYIEDEKAPVFISIITSAQKEAYIKAGYKPVVVDENAGTIDQYYILYGQRYKTRNQAAQLQNPAFKQKGLLLAAQLTEYTTLIKLAEGTHFAKLDIEELHGAKVRRLLNERKPNADVASPDIEKQLAKAKASPVETQEKQTIPFGLIFSLLIIAAVLGYFFMKNRSLKRE